VLKSLKLLAPKKALVKANSSNSTAHGLDYAGHGRGPFAHYLAKWPRILRATMWAFFRFDAETCATLADNRAATKTAFCDLVGSICQGKKRHCGVTGRAHAPSYTDTLSLE